MPTRTTFRAGTILTAILTAALLTYAQEPEKPQPTVKVDVNLVLVNATVVDSENRYVTSLEQQHFQIWEDKVEQKIEYFSAEDSPLSLGIVLDVSGSMKDKIATARDAAAAFLQTGNPDDEYFLLEFSSRPQMVTDFTTDIGRLQSNLISGEVKGMTALYDALYLAIEKVKGGSNSRKAVLLITDGEDNHSHYTYSNVRELIKESDVQIYIIGIADEWASTLRSGQTGHVVIRQLAELGGGHAFFPDSVYELEDIATRISVELKNQYVLGYSPANEAKDGRWRKIRVKVKPLDGLPQLSVRTKTGYFAPSGT